MHNINKQSTNFSLSILTNSMRCIVNTKSNSIRYGLEKNKIKLKIVWIDRFELRYFGIHFVQHSTAQHSTKFASQIGETTTTTSTTTKMGIIINILLCQPTEKKCSLMVVTMVFLISSFLVNKFVNLGIVCDIHDSNIHSVRYVYALPKIAYAVYIKLMLLSLSFRFFLHVSIECTESKPTKNKKIKWKKRRKNYFVKIIIYRFGNSTTYKYLNMKK